MLHSISDAASCIMLRGNIYDYVSVRAVLQRPLAPLRFTINSNYASLYHRSACTSSRWRLLHSWRRCFFQRAYVHIQALCWSLKVGIQQVENTLFRVHRYFFARDSAWFRDKLPYPLPPGETTKGSSDNLPLVLEGITKTEFERFLWVFYNPSVRLSYCLTLFDINLQKIFYLRCEY